eukprot:763576-Hanusia_phi.AAC.10
MYRQFKSSASIIIYTLTSVGRRTTWHSRASRNPEVTVTADMRCRGGGGEQASRATDLAIIGQGLDLGSQFLDSRKQFRAEKAHLMLQLVELLHQVAPGLH